MGQWATRHRRGGAAPLLNYMRDATLLGGDQISIEYAYNVDASRFQAAAFDSTPSGGEGIAVINVNPRLVQMTMDIDVTGDTDLTYTGVTPGVRTPQAIQY